MSQPHIHTIKVADATHAFIGYCQNINARRFAMAAQFRQDLLRQGVEVSFQPERRSVAGATPLAEIMDGVLGRIADRIENGRKRKDSEVYAPGVESDTLTSDLRYQTPGQLRGSDASIEKAGGTEKFAASPSLESSASDLIGRSDPRGTALSQRDRTS